MFFNALRYCGRPLIRHQRILPVRQRRFIGSGVINQIIRLSQLSEPCPEPPSRGLVLGVYAEEKDKKDPGILTPTAWKFNKQVTNGRLLDVLRMIGPLPKRGETRLFYGLEPEKIPVYSVIAVVGLGAECLGYDSYEVIDVEKEAIRRSVAAAVAELRDLGTRRVDVESMGHAESAAEGAGLGAWLFQEFKEFNTRYIIPHLDLYSLPNDECDIEGWRIGMQKAAAQNLARYLQEMPSNVLTPTAMAENVVEVLSKSGCNVEVKVEGWARSQGMNAFLTVAKASCEPPLFLEISYYGTDPAERPVVLVGQGTTYDTGGLCVKDFKELRYMRGDMTGAAVVIATCRAVALLGLKINIRGLIPLCENLVGCNSFHPGDNLKAVNGKRVEVQSTDHDQSLVLMDALCYAQNFCPKCVIDVGTTSGSMRFALEEAASGVFTNSEIMWQKIRNASIHTGDRVWRFPLWDYYTKQVTWTDSTDVMTGGKGRGGRPCKAAAFLREFVPCGQWMHIDATNVMHSTGKHFEYIRQGMAGRPTRTLLEFIAQMTCCDTAPKIKDFKLPK